jgi:nitroreductase
MGARRSQTMDIVEAIRSRKSIRGYESTPVSKETLKEILAIATQAPSGDNAQTWELTVVTGEVLDNIRWGNVDRFTSGVAPNPDFPLGRLEGIYRERQVNLAIQLFQLMGIAREDRDRRIQWRQRGYRFFDAPAAIILSADSSLTETRILLDTGLITQSICLVALNYGLGTCIGVQGVQYPEVVRKFTSIPESKRIIVSIAIGYPGWDFPANKLESEREPLENMTTWCGFE